MPPVPKREFVQRNDSVCGPSWSNGRFLIVASPSQRKPFILYRVTERKEPPVTEYVGRYLTLDMAMIKANSALK